MNLSRRGLFGMFAAGAGAAIIPAGILMPIKPSLARPTSKWFKYQGVWYEKVYDYDNKTIALTTNRYVQEYEKYFIISGYTADKEQLESGTPWV